MKFSYAEEYNDPFGSKLTINIDGDINDNMDAVLKELEETHDQGKRKADFAMRSFAIR